MKDKIKKMLIKLEIWLKTNKLYYLSFIIGIAIICSIYCLNYVAPFGKDSLLCVDFYHQYGPMLGEFYDRVKTGENLIYSFTMGMGLPFFRNFLNYLSSPFNIILFLFKRENLIMSYSIIIGLKAICSSTTMVYYLSKKFNTKQLFLLPLGIIYGFSSYFAAYYWNIMWLDGMVFLPIITLGIENLINEKKWKLYTISLAVLLFSNYFMGYMVCIFAVVYFLLYLILQTHMKKGERLNSLEDALKKCLLFGTTSLAAGGLAAFALIPLAKSISSISATGGSFVTTSYYPFKLLDFLKGHFTGVDTTVFASDEITIPNISCGILSIALLYTFLVNFKIPIKQKIIYILTIGFLIFAFFYAPMDYIWHAFHVPNDLPYRYSFIYSFVLVTIGAYGLINIKKIKFPFIALGYLLIMACLFAMLTTNWVNLTTNMIYINMILITLYFIFYAALYFLDRLHTLFYIAITIVACLDVIVSIDSNWNITQVLSNFYSDYEATEKLLSTVKDGDNELFFRIENTNMMTLNDPSWYNYNGMTTFSSMAYESMAKLQNRLGQPGNNINSYYYAQTTPIYDLMFDLKYFIGESNDTIRYDSVYTDEETANKFMYNVGLMFGVNKDIKYWNYTNNNPFIIQNDFIEKSTGVKDVLENTMLLTTTEVYKDDSITILKYEFDNPGDNLYYYSNDSAISYMIVGNCLYYNDDKYSTTTSYSDELYYTYLEDYNEEKVINIKSGEDKITLYVAYNYYYSNAFSVYNINQEKFEDAYQKLINSKVDLTSFKENKITGKINVTEDQIIYTSIPYDEGWHVYIDGQEVDTYSLADSLLTFNIKKGNHKITLKYEIPYLGVGILTTTITIVLMIFSKRISALLNKILDKLATPRKKTKKISKKEEHKKNKKTKKK